MFKSFVITLFIVLFASSLAYAQFADTVGRDGSYDVAGRVGSITWKRLPNTFDTCSPDFDLEVRVTGDNKGWRVESFDTSIISVKGGILHIVRPGKVLIYIYSTRDLNGTDDNGIFHYVEIVKPALQPFVHIDTNYTTACDGKTLTYKNYGNYLDDTNVKWLVNGIFMGLGNQFSSSSLKDNDKLSCVISAPVNCKIPINDSLLVSIKRPSIKIKPLLAGTVCAGTRLSILATLVNIDTTLVNYQWRVNGNNIIGTTGTVFTSVLNNNDVVDCLLSYRTDASCTETFTVLSNPLTISVNLTQSPTVDITPDNNPTCPSVVTTFTAAGNNNSNNPVYQWMVNGKNAGTNNPTFTGTFKNNDVVTCSISNSECTTPTVSTPVVMKLYSAPTIKLAKTMNVVLGKSAQLIPVIKGNIAKYVWSPLLGLTDGTVANPTTMPVNNITYTLSVTSVDGCTAEAMVAVNLIVPIIVPNTFTPNGDGTNDTWNIPSLTYYPHCIVRIYNRGGSPLFQSAGYGKAWDGSFNGKPLPVGTYYYIIDSDADKGAKVSGSVTIMR